MYSSRLLSDSHSHCILHEFFHGLDVITEDSRYTSHLSPLRATERRSAASRIYCKTTRRLSPKHFIISLLPMSLVNLNYYRVEINMGIAVAKL